MESSVSVCPVPHEQQPVNEYQQLKESWFFSWVLLDWQGYSRKLFWVWLLGWLVAGPVTAASFAPSKQAWQFALGAAGGASIGLVLVLLRLYLGWSYVSDRLLNPAVFYEESGWYDGQVWQKPPEVLARDRLLVTYQIQPTLRRLRLTFGLLALCFGSGAIAWQWL